MTIECEVRQPRVHQAEIVREYGPFADADCIHGVTHDGQRVEPPAGVGPDALARRQVARGQRTGRGQEPDQTGAAPGSGAGRGACGGVIGAGSCGLPAGI